MTFSPRIRMIHGGNIQPDPLTRRPRIIASQPEDPKNGIVLVYADWCPHCRMFKPWFNEYAEKRAPQDALLAVVSSDDVEDIFESGEISGFPAFKRIVQGQITRDEVSVDRSSPEAAFESLRNILEVEVSPAVSDVHKPLAELEERLHELEQCRHRGAQTDAMIQRLRAELAKAAAMEMVYQRQLLMLKEQLRTCEEAAKPAPKRRAASKKPKSATSDDKPKTKPKSKSKRSTKSRSSARLR